MHAVLVDRHRTFNAQLAQAAREMAGEHDTENTLDRAVLLAVETVPPCDAAGVSLKLHGSLETPAASSEEFRKLDQMQYEMREGPCWDALHQQDSVTSGDLASDARWPEWGPRVAGELGLRSAMGFRLFTTRKALGALNMFSRKIDAFGPEDHVEGLALSAHIAVALAATQQEEQFVQALDTRTLIGQATGILMERFQLDHDTAFRVLTRVSQRTNTKIRSLALELVESGNLEGLHR